MTANSCVKKELAVIFVKNCICMIVEVKYMVTEVSLCLAGRSFLTKHFVNLKAWLALQTRLLHERCLYRTRMVVNRTNGVSLAKIIK